MLGFGAQKQPALGCGFFLKKAQGFGPEDAIFPYL